MKQTLTYTGPTVMAPFSRPKRPTLIHGQRVIPVALDLARGTVTVQYDATDPKHERCYMNLIDRIKDVPADQLIRLEEVTR